MRLDVGEEDDGRLARGLAELRVEVCEDVQLCRVGVSGIEVVVVVPTPEKRFATGDALEAACVDAALLQKLVVVGIEVVAHDPD
ncbi:hypothetical protein HRbin41_01526 [bacterium HR41]|nr:hypothetical protein HRbin41_01526 [bacterium HR41]